MHFSCFKPTNLGHFVTTALESWYGAEWDEDKEAQAPVCACVLEAHNVTPEGQEQYVP